MQVAQSHGHNDIDTAISREEAFTQVIRKNYDLAGCRRPGNHCHAARYVPHAVISVISGHLPGELSSEIAGGVDVMIEKPVSIMTFSQFLETSGQICDAMDKIRLLGTAPAVVR